MNWLGAEPAFVGISRSVRLMHPTDNILPDLHSGAVYAPLALRLRGSTAHAAAAAMLNGMVAVGGNNVCGETTAMLCTHRCGGGLHGHTVVD